MSRQIFSQLLAALLVAGLAPWGCGAETIGDQGSNLAPLEPLLAPRTLLLLGEIHGTVEAPAAVSEIVALALSRDQSVLVALEIPREEEARLAGFLASPGEPADRRALLAGTFWQSSYQDGRRSEAMASLLDDLRGLIQSGKPLRVALIDRRGARGTTREQEMAEALAAAVATAPEDFAVALVGNLHAQLARGAGHGVEEPMALRAAPLLPDTRMIALQLVSAGGTAWICGGYRSGTCGISELGGRKEHQERQVTVADNPVSGGFHGTFSVGSIHASPPAVETHRTPEAMTVATRRKIARPDSSGPSARPAAALHNPVSALNPAGDWPRWMGPLGTGAAKVQKIFPADRQIELGVSWRSPIGRGYSSVSVAGQRAYTLAADDDKDWLLALGVRDGGELWRLPLDDADRQWPSSTPAIAGGTVFALNPRGKLHAVSAADGAPIWSHDLQQTLGAVPHSYGMSTSPLIVDELLVVLVGGREAHNLVAFDKASGGIVWSVAHAKWSSYASPTLLTIAGERQVLAPADDRLYAVRPADGSLLWSYDALGQLDRIPLPLPGNRIFVAQETGAAMLRLVKEETRWRVEELWKSNALKYSYSPAVHLDGALFGFDGPTLVCVDAGSGAVRWRERVGDGSLILVDGHLVVMGALSGTLRVVSARPDRFDERASIRVLTKGEGYAAPSYAGGRIFVRDKHEMAAVEIAAR